MIKVIEFISSLSTGGAESLVTDYIYYMNKEKFYPSAVIRYNTISSRNKIVLKDVNAQVLGLTKSGDENRSFLPRVLIMIRTFVIFRQYLKKNSVNVIHMHLENNKYLYFAKKYLKNTQLIYTVHNEPKKVFEGSLNNRVDYWCTKQLIEKYGMQLIALHDDMRVELNKLFHLNNTIVLNNGVDLKRFQAKLYRNDREKILDSLGFSNEDFIVGHIGRFEEQKNHSFLLDVFVKLLIQKPKAKLLLVGSGTLKGDILARIKEQNITDKVVILENCSDIPQLMSIMNVFVFPSLYEGLSVTLVEAQSMGLKCIVSNTVSTATHLTDQFIPVSLQYSATAWSKIILDDAIRTTPQGNLADFDIKTIVKQLEKVYEQDSVEI